MAEKNDLWENEFWTQKEVADHFRVVSGTVKNWREKGLLKFWQAPGSTRVLFFRDDIREFTDNHISKKGGDKKPKAEIIKVKPCVSSPKKEWRI